MRHAELRVCSPVLAFSTLANKSEVLQPSLHTSLLSHPACALDTDNALEVMWMPLLALVSQSKNNLPPSVEIGRVYALLSDVMHTFSHNL